MPQRPSRSHCCFWESLTVSYPTLIVFSDCPWYEDMSSQKNLPTISILSVSLKSLKIHTLPQEPLGGCTLRQSNVSVGIHGVFVSPLWGSFCPLESLDLSEADLVRETS